MEKLNDNKVPIYKTPKGLFTNLEALDYLHNKFHATFSKLKNIAFLEYDEYECGLNCTPDGCEGHTNKHASGISIDGVTLWVEGAEEGDFPTDDEEYNDKVHDILEQISDFFNSRKKDGMDNEKYN